MLTRNLNDKKTIWLLFEGSCYFYNLRMVELAEEFLLIHDRIDTAFGDNARLSHLFHGKWFLFLDKFNAPHLAKTSSSDDELEAELVFVDFYTIKVR